MSKLVKVSGAGVAGGGVTREGRRSGEQRAAAGSPAPCRSQCPPALSPPAPHPGVRAGRALCHGAVLCRQQAEEAGPDREGAEPSSGKVFSKLAQGGGGRWGLPAAKGEVGAAFAHCGAPTDSWPGILVICAAPPVLSCLEVMQEEHHL